MTAQNQVVLSLGSNLGIRLENMQLAIDKIHNEVGTVVKISPIYETPSWGFSSEMFFNCVVLIHTDKSANKILSKIAKIEKNLGRIKTESEEYQPRTIDIDIVYFNEETINTENLTIPHAQMHKRLFVLLPLKDLGLNFKHPIFNKSTIELISVCEDQSECKILHYIKPPLKNIKLDSFNYIAIEGNIGAGKTTLTTKIAEDFNAKTVLERFADNPFLPKFYKDQNRYAFPLEMSFLADRYQQLSDDLAQFDLFKDFIISDYHIFKSIIFAKVTLQEDEFRLYKTMFDIIYKEMPKPDLYIYLYQNTERLLENIKKRGRNYEQQIPAEYLEKINQGYLDYIKSKTDWNVLVIDVSDKDFVKKQSDYLFILEEIRSKLGG